jgi:hypothetical protein
MGDALPYGMSLVPPLGKHAQSRINAWIKRRLGADAR